MPWVEINRAFSSVEESSNILNDTSYFHLIEGQLCDANGILISEVVAEELGVNIGDEVSVIGMGVTETYTVSGIYMCANGMGSNIGMSLAGYSKIGDINGFIWCTHYILEDGSMRNYIVDYLRNNYQSIDVHTNSWSGLDGIVSVMHRIVLALFIVSALFVMLVINMLSNSFIREEKQNLAIYKSIGINGNNEYACWLWLH